MTDGIQHSVSFRLRRGLNWFPMGVTYAFLYMGRYNLTVAKTELDKLNLMTKEDFGIIFAVGTLVYAIAFLVNGPLIDRIGGRLGILIAAAGAAGANAAMAFYLTDVLSDPDPAQRPLRLVFSILYGANMYFQSFGAVSIVKVNAHWFHVRERGGFSGIFGTMISSGVFLAFTVNGWLLDLARDAWPGERMQWIVFAIPAGLLAVAFVIELFLLRDRPGLAGFDDFDTGDASSGDDDQPESAIALYKRILTNPLILIIAGVEFCTGVLRNGVMHWFPIYAKEVWALEGSHGLVYGAWSWKVALALWGVALVSAALAFLAKGGPGRAYLIIGAGVSFLTPFLWGGWGGLLFVAGVIGGNVAGWVSDLFFQSRRAPSAGGLYFLLSLCAVGMIFALSLPTSEVAAAGEGTGLRQGDIVVEVAGQPVTGWAEVRGIVACFEPVCVGSTWDPEACACTTRQVQRASAPSSSAGFIPAVVLRGGERVAVDVKDPLPEQRAGEKRKLKARPVLPLSPWVLGILVFLVSTCVIGTHGLLSGTATMDFGGRKGAATAVGAIDGAVYAGTALQSVSLGYLTSASWSYWPIFLLPFAAGGFALLRFTRIWHATPKRGGGGH